MRLFDQNVYSVLTLFLNLSIYAFIYFVTVRGLICLNKVTLHERGNQLNRIKTVNTQPKGGVCNLTQRKTGTPFKCGQGLARMHWLNLISHRIVERLLVKRDVLLRQGD